MATIFTGDAKSAWSMYLKVLEDFLGSDHGYSVIQPFALAEKVRWDSSKTNYNIFEKQLLADRMADWSAIANFNGKWVSDNYEHFLSMIQGQASNQLTSEQNKLLENATKKRTTSQASLRRLEKEIKYRWEQYKSDMDSNRVPKLTRRQFETGRGYDSQRAELKLQIRTASGDYAAIINQAGGIVRIIGKAVEDFYSDYAEIPLPSLPDFDLESEKDTWALYKRQWVLGDIERFKTEQSELVVEFDHLKAESSTIQKHWDGNVGIRVGWFSFGGSASRTEIERKSSEQTEKVKFTFKNVAEFPIFRDKWYKVNLIDQYGADTQGLWGPNGSFNVIPVSYILAKGITVEATTTDEVKQYMESQFSAGGTVGIGPFNFGGSNSETRIHSSFDRTNTGIKITDISNSAHIIAVKSFTPYFRND
jgi:hypothetical protein